MLPTLDSSFLFLLLGKDSPWIPWIILAVLLVQKGPMIAEWFERRIWMWGKAEYILSGTLYTDKRTGMCHGALPNELEAFLHFLQTSKLTQSIQKGITLFIGCTMMTESQSVTIPMSDHGVWVQPGLWAKFQMTTEHSQFRKGSHGEDEMTTAMLEECKLTITLQAHEGDFSRIRNFIKDCCDTYTEYKMKSREDHIYVVKPAIENNRNIDSECSRYIPFHSNKTFDNLFFPEKLRLLHRLAQFKDNRSAMVTRMGLPNTLGLLFYGEPGTGKTSAIKAIANYMQMHLVIVPMNKIKTRKDLEQIFFDKNVCYLPFDKRIYVFEEIDCNGWEHIVVDRKHRPPVKEEDVQSDDWDDTDVHPIKRRVTLRKKKEENDKLTLGAVLEILDGVIECPGRIVILTTNHREVLDPALIRPGRIDMEIEFGKVSRGDIAAMYERMWEMEAPKDMLERMPESRYTQAELSQILYRHAEDPNNFLSALIE